MEQHTDLNPNLRPADLLVFGLFPRPLALDVTVWSRHSDGADTLDVVVQRKNAAAKTKCNRQGWTFQPFAADVYGALHPNARRLISRLAGILQRSATDANLSLHVWMSLSAAVVSRAAGQLARHSAFLANSEDFPEQPSDTLGIPSDSVVGQPGVTGEGEEASDDDEQEEAIAQATAAAAVPDDPIDVGEEPTVQPCSAADVIRLLVRLPSGSCLPATATFDDTVEALLHRVLERCGLPGPQWPNVGLALGHVGLDPHSSLRMSDLRDGDRVDLYVRGSEGAQSLLVPGA